MTRLPVMANIWTSFATETDNLMENCVHFVIFILSAESRDDMDERTNPRSQNVRLYWFENGECPTTTEFIRVEWQFRFSNGLISTSWHWDHIESSVFSLFSISLIASTGNRMANLADSPFSDLLRFSICLNRIHSPAAMALFRCLCFCCLLTAHRGRESVFKST